MANNVLQRITFATAQSPFAANDVVVTFYNDSSNTFVVTLNGTDITTNSTYNSYNLLLQTSYDANFTPTNNYSIEFLNIDGTVAGYQDNHGVRSGGEIQFRFCSGTDLTQFNTYFLFPFVAPVVYPNSPLCNVSTVCNIQSPGLPTIVKPSTSTATDGSITVSATSTWSAVRYSLTDIPYAQMTNTSGAFTSLGVGNYTVYCQDIYGCKLAIQAIIEPPLIATVNNAVIYRQEYKDIQGRNTRIDILKRDYAGGITDVKSSGEPFELRLRGENGDFFDSVIASEATQNLISETNFQFVSIYTDDDRKYQVIFYKDTGSGLTEYWRGFITPALYREKYNRDTNYVISLQSTDQLATLKDIDFLDTSGNIIAGSTSLLQIISQILLKTEMYLPIKVAVNLFDSAMSTGATGDPLNQTYIKAESYTGLSCFEVLKNILGSFGANIFQWGGYWHIRRRGEITGSYQYRQYDIYGAYVSNGTATVTTSAWKWEGQSQNLELIGSRGKINITHELKKNIGYYTNADFEQSNITTGYSLYLNGNNAQISKVAGNGSSTGLFIESDSKNTTYGEDAYIITDQKSIILTATDVVKFSFDFFPDYTVGTAPTLFVKFKVSLNIGSYYLQANGSWSTSNQWIEIVTQQKDFNTWTTYEAQALAPVTGTSTTRIRIMHGATCNVHGAISVRGKTWLFANDADLKSYVTVGKSSGYQTWIFERTVESDGLHWDSKIRYYKLRPGTDADSTPTILRPTDYNAVTNPVVWELTNTVTGREDFTALVNGVYPVLDEYSGFVRIFDNLKLEVLPQGVEQPDSKVYSVTTTLKNKKPYEKTLINGDAPVDVTNGLYSYNNVYTLSTGVATRLWTRRGIVESKPLLAILGKQISEQLYIPKYKLTGTLKQTGTFFGFDACLTEYGKYYAIAGMTLLDKMCHAQVEVYQITQELANGVFSEFSQAEFLVSEFGSSFNI